MRRAGLFVWLLLLAPLTRGAHQRAAMVYICHAPESALDVRYDYHWEILRTALEVTRPKWGAYKIVVSERMTERRQAYELKNATGKLNVMYCSKSGVVLTYVSRPLTSAIFTSAR
jgi:hypothetical protein